jgi:hypothetical protein
MESYSQKLFLVSWPAAVLENGELMPAAGPCKLTFSCSGALRVATSSWSLGADLQLFLSMESYSQQLFLVG